MTEWATIKVPAETREEAKELPCTYHETLRAGIQAMQRGTVEENPIDTLEFDGRSRFESIDELFTSSVADIEELKDQLDRIESAQAHTVSDALELAESDQLMRKLDKAIEIAEQARDNTEEIKGRMH